MNPWSAIAAEAQADLTVAVVVGLLVTLTVVRTLAPGARRSNRGMVILAGLHLVLVPVAGILKGWDADLHRDVRLVCVSLAALAGVSMAATLLFRVLLPRLHLALPKILQDVLVATTSAVAIFTVASRVGYDLSGLLTTSAILTAVIGLALQDTLGNVVGGLAVQSDDSIRVGDWIEIDQVSGRVTEIRWRYTAIETRDWETVYIPNGQLVKRQVTVLGRRDGESRQWRRWIHFNVDFRYAPSDVIRVVEDALNSAPIDRVSAEPRPQVILHELKDSYATYAIRYWLTDPAFDDPTDSVVRTRLYFALRRAGIPLSLPAQAVFVTQESHERKVEKREADYERRKEALARVTIFRDLSDDDRTQLAANLHYVPFTAGEAITRQGAEAHWLYLLVAGEVSVRMRSEDGTEREIAHLEAGSFFGEMSLLTGARRAATIVALTDVECYRLDKMAFESIVRDRPEVAESVAQLLARRRMELTAVREETPHPIEPKRLAEATGDLLQKIRFFFGLEESDDKRRTG